MVKCALWGVSDGAGVVLWIEGGGRYCSYSPTAAFDTPNHVLLTYMEMRWKVGLVPF
jgi:hypothetical protein